jgi:hypothetical protein
VAPGCGHQPAGLGHQPWEAPALLTNGRYRDRMADTVSEAGITPTRARMQARLTRLPSRPVETPSAGGRGDHPERGDPALRRTLPVPRPAAPG